MASFPTSNPLPQSDYYHTSSLKKARGTSALLLKRASLTRTTRGSRLVLVLVGLPGRGKSFIARKLLAYLQWRGNRVKVFNVGKYRRERADSVDSFDEDTKTERTKTNSADFFSTSNVKAQALREALARLALDDMFSWFNEVDTEDGTNTPEPSPTSGGGGGSGSGSGRGSNNGASNKYVSSVAIFDATNSTEKRRRMILDLCKQQSGTEIGVVYIESLCDDQHVLEENYLLKVKNSPDFANMTVQEGMRDLRERVENYEKAYETIVDDDLSYERAKRASERSERVSEASE